MPNFINRTGLRFGKLLVSDQYKSENKNIFWLCYCDCGTQKWIRTGKLCTSSPKKNQIKSCGCFTRELNSIRMKKEKTIHGLSASAEYNIWTKIKQRCANPNDKSYFRYGGRGIFVCKRWLNSFEAFYSDMKDRPSKKHSIERINNNSGYTCGKCDECLSNGYKQNCDWKTAKEQANNRRSNYLITFNNRTQTLAQWSIETGLFSSTIWHRIEIYNWSIEKSLTEHLHINQYD